MTLFHECSLAQIVLFEIGGLSQFIAICAFVRERMSGHDDSHSHFHHDDDDDGHEPQTPTHRHEPSIAQQASSYHIMPAPAREEHENPAVHAADLVKTAKVKFKQSFKARQE